jgi:hypothetical protein
MKAQVTRSWRSTSSGKPELTLVATGDGVSVRWTCACGFSTLREDFPRGFVCRRCGAAVTLDEAMEITKSARAELNSVLALLRSEAKQADELGELDE